MRKRLICFAMTAALLAASTASAAPASFSRFAGGGQTPVVNRDALGGPYGLVKDLQGALLVSDQGSNIVRRYSPGPDGVIGGGQSSDDTITTVAGNYKPGFSGDGGPAKDAQMYGIQGIAIGPLGDLYIADYQNHRVRRVVPGADGIVDGDEDEQITTIAGDGWRSTSWPRGYGRFLPEDEGGPATTASLNFPSGIAVDPFGWVFIADTANRRVRAISPAGIITTVAGSGCDVNRAGPCPIRDGGPAKSASLVNPADVAFDLGGNLLIADTHQHRIRRVSPGTDGVIRGEGDEMIETIAGDGQPRFAGDGGPAVTASLKFPRDMIVDGPNLYIADTYNHAIRKVDAFGNISTVAGTGAVGTRPGVGAPAQGDGGDATAAKLNHPSSVTLITGSIFVADTLNLRVRRVAPDGNITTSGGDNRVVGCCTDNNVGGQWTTLLWPQSVVTRGSTTFVSDTGTNRVIRFDEKGRAETIAGIGLSTHNGYPLGDGGPANKATLSGPVGLALDAGGNLFIADSLNQRIRRVDALSGTITTVVGNGIGGYLGDGGHALDGNLYYPSGVALDPTGNIYITEIIGNRLRKVDVVTKTMSTLAGSPSGDWYNSVPAPDLIGEGVPATSVKLARPKSVTYHQGSLYVTDSMNQRVRRIDLTTGLINTVAGNGAGLATAVPASLSNTTGSLGALGDGLAAKAASLALAMPAPIVLPVADSVQVVGEFQGASPWAAEVTFDQAGNMYIPDTWNQRIRKVTAGADGVVTGSPDETISTIAGTGCWSVPPFQIYQPQRWGAKSLPSVSGCSFQEVGDGLKVNLRFPTSVAFLTSSLLVVDSNWSGATSGGQVNSRVRRLTGF